MSSTQDPLPDDIEALKAALLAERAARRESEARAAGAEAMVAHLKLLVAIFEKMMRRHPDLDPGVRRKLERRIRTWRAIHSPVQEVIFR